MIWKPINAKIEGLEEFVSYIKSLEDRITALENINSDNKKREEYWNKIYKQLDDEFNKSEKIIEENLAQLEECITPNNYIININIDKYSSDKMSTDELYKQILDGLKKLGK